MSDLTPTGIPPIPEAAAYTPPIPAAIPPPPATDIALSANDKTMGMLCHLIAFTGLIVPFGNILGPLVVWLTQKDKSAFADSQGKESVNFQITIAMVLVPCFLFLVLFAFLLIGFLAIPVMSLIVLYAVVMTIIASVKANEGVPYRYPFTLRLLK